MSASPLRGRIRLRDELRHGFARRAPCCLIQGVEILPDGSARPGNGLPVNLVRPSSRTLLVGVSGNQAGIDRKSGARLSTLLPCSAEPRSRTACAADRNHGSGHACFWRMSSGPAPRHQARADRTSGRRGSDAPPRTTAVRNECRSSSQPAASARAVRDQSKAGQLSRKMAPSGSEHLTNRRTGRSPSASEWPEHVVQVRTRRITPPDRLAADPSSIYVSRPQTE